VIPTERGKKPFAVNDRIRYLRLQSAQCTPQVPDGSYFISWNDYGVRQTALFADGSYKFTDQWKLSAGARSSPEG
jgi:hypothetical protein